MLLQLEARRPVASKNLAIFLEAASSGRSVSGEVNWLNGPDVNDRSHTVKVWQYDEMFVRRGVDIVLDVSEIFERFVISNRFVEIVEIDKTKKNLEYKLIAIKLPFEISIPPLKKGGIFSREKYKASDRWSSVRKFPVSFVRNFRVTSLTRSTDTILTIAQVWKMCSPILINRDHAFFIVVGRGVTASTCILAIYKASHLRRLFARRVCVRPAVVIIPLPSCRFSLHAIASRYHPLLHRVCKG